MSNTDFQLTDEEKDVAIFSHRVAIAKMCREHCVEANSHRDPKRSEMLTWAFYEAGKAGIDIDSLRLGVDQFNERVSQGII